MRRALVATTLGYVAWLLFGLGSCAEHSPATVSPHDVPRTESGEAAAEPKAEDLFDDPSASCATGTANCDRDQKNGCEVSLTDDPENCGACGTDCAAFHATTGCVGGICRILHCESAFSDADADPKNGCEAPTAHNAATAPAKNLPLPHSPP